MNMYVLEGNAKNAVKFNDPIKWTEEMKNIKNKQIAKKVKNGVTVSTVFLGLDYNFGSGKPLVFETLVFRGKHDGEMLRYSTWTEALKGHKKMCRRVFNT